ncbi:hypothetical protein PMAYCL1PPCAC_27531, partial [Pristionchus mayeri]
GNLLETLSPDNISDHVIWSHKHLSLLAISTVPTHTLPSFAFIYRTAHNACNQKFTEPAEQIAHTEKF